MIIYFCSADAAHHLPLPPLPEIYAIFVIRLMPDATPCLLIDTGHHQYFIIADARFDKT